MSKIFDELREEIKRGLQGENGVIPFPLERMNYFLNIAKNVMTIIGGESGSSKTSFTTEIYILYPLLWYLKHRETTNIKLSVVYFGMERKQYRSTARWLSRIIFADRGILIPVKKILGVGEDKLTDKELKLIGEYKYIFEEVDPLLTCYEGVMKAEQIGIYLQKFAEKNGKLEISTDENGMEVRKYTPNHPNHVTLCIVDHIGLIATQNKKQEIDKFSQIMRVARDTYSFSPVIVQQMNRSVSSVERIKQGDLQPKLSDFQDSSGTIQDADVVIALFDPYRHVKDLDSLGYELSHLRDEKGVKYYRSMHILKNSFDSDGISAGLAFYPFCSMFKTLPKPEDMNPDIAFKIRSGNYFHELNQLPQPKKEPIKL